MTLRTPLVKVGANNVALPSGDHVEGDIGLVTLRNLGSIWTDLEHGWQFNETSGTRYDYVGNSDLTPRGEISYTDGLLDEAVTIGPVWYEDWLDTSKVSTMELDADWSASVWFKPNRWNQYSQIMTAGDDAYQHVQPAPMHYRCDYQLMQYGTNAYFSIALANPAYGGNGLMQISTPGVPEGEFGLMCVKYDHAAQKIGINVNNNGWVESAAFTDGWTPDIQNYDFRFGCTKTNAASYSRFEIAIDTAYIWKGSMLTEGLVSYLYNDGAGRLLPYTDDHDLVKCMPVYLCAPGTMYEARANTFGKANVVGLVAEDTIGPREEGLVQTNGVLEATTTQWDAVTGDTGGLDVGARYFLGGAGALVQEPYMVYHQDFSLTPIGTALSSTKMKINIKQPILL